MKRTALASIYSFIIQKATGEQSRRLKVLSHRIRNDTVRRAAWYGPAVTAFTSEFSIRIALYCGDARRRHAPCSAGSGVKEPSVSFTAETALPAECSITRFDYFRCDVSFCRIVSWGHTQSSKKRVQQLNNT